MKLFYSKGACSLVVRIVINEIGLETEYESVDLKTKQTETGKNFLEFNPKGSVPALRLDDGKMLTENQVIQQYLADTHNVTSLLPPEGDFNRYRVLEWLNYVATELHKGFSPLFNPSIPQAIKDEIFIPTIKSKFAFVNKNLGEQAFIYGDTFTLPDAYLFVMLMWAVNAFKFDLQEWPNLARYFAALKQRDSIINSLRAESLIPA